MFIAYDVLCFLFIQYVLFRIIYHTFKYDIRHRLCGLFFYPDKKSPYLLFRRKAAQGPSLGCAMARSRALW